MKRSKSVKLVAMGTGLLLVAACEEAKVDTALFESVKQCTGLGFSEQECAANYQQAQQTHVAAAPKYTSQADCEADFGAEKCEIAPQRTTTGGSVFMPLMAGYLMGSMLSGGGRVLFAQVVPWCPVPKWVPATLGLNGALPPHEDETG